MTDGQAQAPERKRDTQRHVLCSLWAGATLLTWGRPKRLPPRIDPDDDAAVARWARGAWRGWKRAGADAVKVQQVNPAKGERTIPLATHRERRRRGQGR